MFKLAIIMSLFIVGCSSYGFEGSKKLPLLFPTVDQTIHSLKYYLEKNNVDCLQYKHSIGDEIEAANHAAATFNKFTSKISIMGTTPRVDARINIYKKVKKVGENDYLIACTKKYEFEKQISDVTCWAACSQYLVTARFGKAITQQAILDKIKPGKNPNDLETAAEVSEIINTLGFMGMTYTKDGARQLLDTLAEDQPVMIGLLPNEKDSIGHAVVVVGARFSFTSAAFPKCFLCSQYAFNQFIVLDPIDGSQRVVDASDYEGRIYFVLSYFSIT